MDIFVEQILDGDGNFLYYDLAFESGKLKTVDGIDEIKNRIITNLNTYLGENYRDTSAGIDYLNNVFNREVTDTVVQDEMKAGVIDTRGVTQLTAFSLTRTAGSRTGNLDAQAKSTEGEIDLVTPISL